MTKIKICGLTRPEDVASVNRYGPDYIGFVFVENTRRRVTQEQAARLKRALRPDIVSVGVFRNADPLEIVALYEKGVIEMAQLHGDEDTSYVSDLRARGGMKIIQAFGVNDEADALRASASLADYVLLDHGGGGTGIPFDWDVTRRVMRTRWNRPWFIAGGIEETNIEEALSLKPHCIDVSGGAETGGVKDGKKIAALVLAAHGG
jgi:phosphoribosylanthranilate isomerase